MKNIIFVILLILFFPQASFAFDDGDFQYWNTNSISVKFLKKFKIKATEELRFGNNAGKFYYQHTDIGVGYSMADWINLSANYRLIFEKKNGNWNYINTPYLNATVKYNKFERIKFSDRNRIEYRDKEKGKDGWRYRNKLKVIVPFKIKNIGIDPYVADEIFIDFVEEKFTKNRLYAGMNMKVLKHLHIDVYYLFESNMQSKNKWTSNNILGTKLKLVF